MVSFDGGDAIRVNEALVPLLRNEPVEGMPLVALVVAAVLLDDEEAAAFFDAGEPTNLGIPPPKLDLAGVVG